MIARSILRYAVVMTIAISLSASLQALNISTHGIINIAAADYPGFGEYLRKSLSISAGQLLRRRGDELTAAGWLGEGGEREDDGSPLTGRFHNHFHNPLKPWAEAGLHAIRHHPSSARWMQDQSDGAGANWAWTDARNFYLRAVTASDARTREEAAADLFRALGQIMHLVVDASVPEHARDDPHPFGDISRRFLQRPEAGNYEYWVSDQHERQREADFIARYLSNPIGFDASLLRMPPPAGETVAKVPIARLIDSDRYTATAPDPNVTLNGAIGLAEFANANFFSEDTLHGRFPFPRRELLVASPRVAPKSGNVRVYMAKPPGQGQPTGVALAECASERSVGRWVVSVSPPYPCVDEAVWEETASHMLPRAVGYARGVLDYFFRGRFRLYSVSGGQTAAMLFFNDSDEPMEGTFEVFEGSASEHRRRVASTHDFIACSSSGELEPRQGSMTVGPGGACVAQWTTTAAATLREHVLVFRGRLGLEANAVASRTFILSDQAAANEES